MVGVAHERWRPDTTAHHFVPWQAIARSTGGVLAIAYVALTLATFAVGFLVTDGLNSSLGHWDNHVNATLVPARTHTWNAITATSTSVMNTLPVVVAVAVLVALFVWRRWWWEAGLVACGMLLEITVFLSTTFVIARPRPDVPRLNSTPATGSFPSGHTAAATVLCVSLAYIVTRHFHNGLVRAGAWLLAAILAGTVAYGRVYRGLHHPSDVIAGMALGIACVVAAVCAVRAGQAAAGMPPTARRPRRA